MIERKILKEAYWREEFEATAEDISELSVLTLEAGRPLPVSEMAKSLIDEYCRREEDLIRRQLSKGTIYRPNASFAVGETLVFPHLDFVIGTVVDQRDGRNPEFGSFKVVSVRIDGGRKAASRQFAAELAVPHKLAFTGDLSLEQDLALSPALLFDSYGDVVGSRLDERLVGDSDFVSFNGLWLAADAMAEVTRAVKTPTLTGELLAPAMAFHDLISKQAVRVVAPDMAVVGGINEMRMVAQMADLQHILVAPHNVCSPIGTMAAVHACATMQNFVGLEYHAVGVPWWQDTVHHEGDILDERGYTKVPDAPGIGVEPNEDVIRQHLLEGETYFE